MNNSHKRILFLLPLLFACACIAGTVIDLSQRPTDARIAAMGNAGVAVPGELGTNNPAGLAGMTRRIHASSAVSSLYGSADLLEWCGGVPLGQGMVAMGFTGLQVGNIPEVQETNGRPEVLSMFGSIKNIFSASYAWPWGEQLGWGVTLKYHTQQLFNASASGIAMDLGLLWSSEVSIGMVLRNLVAAPMTWSTGHQDDFPRTGTLGVSHTLHGWGQECLTALDVDLQPSRTPVWHVGMEYKPVPAFAFRAGSDDGQLTMGVGLNYANFRIDYAYLPHSELGESYKASFLYCFSQ